MFAGKSTELLRQLTMHQIAGKSILKVKFSADQRYGNSCHIATHTGQKKEAIPLTTLAEMGDLWRDYDVIGVDEG
jgi:thymidine kinase